MTEESLFARRTQWALASNQLTADVGRLRKEGVSILDLTESNPTRCGFTYARTDIMQALSCVENLSYAPSARGSLSAREAVCAYYQEKGLKVGPEQIFLTSSTSEAYSHLFRLLVNPDEQILFPRPSYPLFSFLGDLNDARMDTYPLVFDKKWHIDFDGLENVLCDDAKALVLVNPNNPTGSFVEREELDKLNALCLQRNIPLICDEVFADFSFDREARHTSLADNDSVLTFTLGGVSKTLGLPQMKLSWIIISGPQDLADAAAARLEVIADTYLSVNTPTQNALGAWLSKREGIQAQINARIKKNYSLLKGQVESAQGCQLLDAQGGWYAVVKIPDTRTEEEWCLSFLNKAHTFVHPGYFFDFDTETFIVVSLLPQEDAFKEGIERILAHIKEKAI